MAYLSVVSLAVRCLFSAPVHGRVDKHRVWVVLSRVTCVNKWRRLINFKF